MFGRRKREERRIRQRGLPARATIVDARPTGDTVPGGAHWQLRLHVSPQGGAPFEAVAEGVCSAGDTPALGAEMEVLHDPQSGRRVLVNGLVPAASAPAGATGRGRSELDLAAPAGPDALIGQIMQAFGGAVVGEAGPRDQTIVGATEVFVNGERVRVDGGPTPGVDHLTNEQLKQLARSDPAGMANEILRRLASGEMVPQNVETNTQNITLDGRAAEQMLDALSKSGLLNDAQMGQIRRQLG